jgi:uncharacterized membrane protein
MKRLTALPMFVLVAGCLTAPPPPLAPYSAIGTEPFWGS